MIAPFFFFFFGGGGGGLRSSILKVDLQMQKSAKICVRNVGLPLYQGNLVICTGDLVPVHDNTGELTLLLS